MPELPEVETMVRGIRSHIEGRKLVAVERCPCKCRPLLLEPKLPAIRRRTLGQAVQSVTRRAKRVVIEMTGGDAFVIEPRMTGLVLLSDPPDVEHLRIVWRFEGVQAFNAVWFWDRRGLGTVRLLNSEELAALRDLGQLGRDALDMTADDWREVCQKTRRPIKVALLDQKLVAGIGNLYASEILHRAKISPFQPAEDLRPAELRRLATAVREVLEDAIRNEGSTLGDGTYRNALNESGSYQNAHRVYARHDERCPTCQRETILRTVQAQRSTFYCPNCQQQRMIR